MTRTSSVALLLVSLSTIGGARRLIAVALLVAAGLNTAACSPPARTVQVPGVSGGNWVDTGLDVPSRTRLRLEATGTVDVGGGWGVHGPEGTTQFAKNFPGYPAETQHRYGLVARLTPSAGPPAGEPAVWAYGDAREYCAARGGRLWLTVNDALATDNTGQFEVRVIQAGAC